MAEHSRSRVTITLGRSGQVVQRAGQTFDSSYSEYHPSVGSKRSVRDRLGGIGDAYSHNNKRQRGDIDRGTASSATALRLGQNDLRLKLMQKNVLKQGQSDTRRNALDLRQTLSRGAQDNNSDLSMQQRMPESMDSRHAVPERRNPSAMRGLPTRGADVLPRTEPRRNSYSPWTLERIKERSPDRILRPSRNLSPQRNSEEVIKRPVMRTYDDTRAVSYTPRDVSDSRGLMDAAPSITKRTMAAASVKSVVPPIARPPPLSGTEQRSSHRVDERLTVDVFLYSLGLEKYIIPFKAEEVDMATLRQMGERDLKELGIPMGPRKKILLALLPRSKVAL